MSAHSPQAGETLQGAGGPNRSDRRGWCSWPPGSSGANWRDWTARCLWTLRAAGTAWRTWNPRDFWPTWTGRPDRPSGPDRTDGRVNDGTSDASVDDEL